MYVVKRNNLSPEENRMIRDWLVPFHDMLDDSQAGKLANMGVDYERCKKMAREGAHNGNMLWTDNDVDDFCIYISFICTELQKKTHPSYWSRLGEAFDREKNGFVESVERQVSALKELLMSLYKKEDKIERKLTVVS
jgi:hypothetical protein